MFDISFSELLIVIFAVILFISPKNIPSIARTSGKMLKKSKSFIDDIIGQNKLGYNCHLESLML